MNLLLISIKNLTRRPSRALLTMCGITIGIIAVLIIEIISNAGKDMINSELDSLGINGVTISSVSGSNYYLDNTDLAAVKTFDYVKEAIPIITDSGRILQHDGEYKQIIIWGIDSGSEQLISLDKVYGNGITSANVAASERVCMIDSEISKQLFSRENSVGAKIMLRFKDIEEEYTIAGIVSSESGILNTVSGEYIPSLIYLPYTTVQAIQGSETINQIAVKYNDQIKDEDMDNYSKLLSNTLNSTKSADAFRAENLSKQRAKLMKLFDIITFVLSLIGGVSLIVAGIGVTTLMLVSVSERTREIGIKKAIGATKTGIVTEFLIEAVIITTIGCIVGIVVAQIIALIATNLLNIKFGLSYMQIISVVAVTLVCGLVFGIYPAKRAANLKPVDALRRE